LTGTASLSSCGTTALEPPAYGCSTAPAISRASSIFLPSTRPNKVGGVGDFDGDGRADILWRSSGGANDVWLLNGTSNLKGFFSLPSVDPSSHPEQISDFDGDGVADILWRSSGGANDVWLLNGTSSLKDFFSLPNVDPSYHAAGTVFDII